MSRPESRLLPAAVVYFIWMTVGVVLTVSEPLRNLLPRVEPWGDMVSLLLGALVSVRILSCDASERQVTIAAGIIMVASTLVEWVGVRFGVPFGHYLYTPRLGPLLHGEVPYVIPACWLILTFCGYAISAFLFSGVPSDSERGVWRVFGGAILVLLVDLNLEPAAANVKHYWLWLDRDLFYYGIPRLNFLGWYGVSFLLMLALDGVLGRVRFRATTAWWSWGTLAMIQLLFAILNWQAHQFVPVMVALNGMGVLAIAISMVSNRENLSVPSDA